jgi:hypothetical protein
MTTGLRHRITDDNDAFARLAAERGWGDGLPLVPPTEERVAAWLDPWAVDPDHAVTELPPSGRPVTFELLAANAVMTGAPGTALPLLASALRAMAEPAFDLHGLNATTGSVVPAVVVSGNARHELDIPFGAGCLGGAEGGAPAIGRTIRLVMRNVAGQRINVTSQSVYGTPGRVAGIVFGEWEERSPWEAFGCRRGVDGDAVTVYAAMGTANICDMLADSGLGLLEVVGKSAAYMGANGFLTSSVFSENLVMVNPVWAELIARDVPDIDEVHHLLWQHASLPIDWFPETHRGRIEDLGRVRGGRVHLVQSPEDHLFMVAGGMGGLHGAMLHSWGATRTITRPVELHS